MIGTKELLENGEERPGQEDGNEEKFVYKSGKAVEVEPGMGKKEKKEEVHDGEM